MRFPALRFQLVSVITLFVVLPGVTLPERVTGADLVPALYEAANEERPLTTYLLGALLGAAENSAKNIEAQWPSVKVVGTYSPPFGFENDEAENKAIIERIQKAKPDMLVVGLGAPKQELWVHKHRDQIDAKNVFVCGRDHRLSRRKHASRSFVDAASRSGMVLPNGL